MTHLTADSRGLILSCPSCSQANRQVYRQWDAAIRCGRCKEELVRPPAVIEVRDPLSFRALVAEVSGPVFVDFGHLGADRVGVWPQKLNDWPA